MEELRFGYIKKMEYGLELTDIADWLESKVGRSLLGVKRMNLRHLIAFLDTNPNSVIHLRPKEEWIGWLKSIKDRVQPQSHWKPTEEQINVLSYTINAHVMEHENTQKKMSTYIWC